MIKIYGHPATSAGRCYWFLEELGIPYERVDVDMRARQHKSPEFLAMNPNGKVPVLQDGSFLLWESVAINFYLAEKHGPAWLGSTAEDRAKTQQWTVWAMAEYQKPVIDLFIQLVFVPEGKRNEDLMAACRVKIPPLNELLNEVLRERHHLINERFTLADLHVASVAKLNKPVGIDISHLPYLSRWLKDASRRPASIKADQMGHFEK